MFGKDLSAEFARFAGKEVHLTNGRDIDNTDPVVVELKDAAEKEGFSLRLWKPPSLMGFDCATMEGRSDRLNAYLEIHPDGKCRIQPKFEVG